MLKKNSICILILIVIMFVLPGITVKFVQADSGMAAMLLILFGINPIVSIETGIFAGKNISAAWFQPLISAVFFVIGSRIFFGIGEKDFLYYAAAYLLLGYSSMLITAFVIKKKN